MAPCDRRANLHRPPLPTRRTWLTGMGICAAAIGILAMLGCSASLLLNPSFVNQATGGVFPLTPGDRSGFVLVRGNNTSSVPIEFVITAERRETATDGSNNTVITSETYHLLTQPDNKANDLGVLIDCPVYRVGLGEVLDQPATEPGIFVGAQAVGAGGFGVPPNVNPLNADAGNFTCGDTIIFVASERAGVAGGVVVRSYVLPAASQPSQFEGLDTFVNARTLVEEEQVGNQP
jgi:hypothetical protein